jgi:uncharacterized RDD family membrane protein YckC
MDCYYSKDGQSIGPVSETKFGSLVESGVITPETSVWKEGMGDWEDYGEVAADFVPSKPKGDASVFDTSDLELALAKAAAAAQSTKNPGETDKTAPATQAQFKETKTSGPSPADPGVSTLGIETKEAPQVVPGAVHACAQCGKKFPEEEMIPYEDAWICADCKPGFFQKLRDEVQADSGLEPAGWMSRMGAKAVDGILLVLFFVMAQIPLIGLLFNAGKPLGNGEIFDPLAANLLWGIGFTLFYSVFFTGRYGATLGKRLFHLKIVNSDGSAVSYEAALGRCVVEFLSVFTLQNRIFATRVVKASRD